MKNGVTELGLKVRQNKVGSYIYFQEDVRAKSVSSLSAQSTEPCDHANDYSKALVELQGLINNEENKNHVLFVLLSTMLAGGLRVSEALGIRYCDIISSNSVVIFAKKRSKNRVVVVGGDIFKEICHLNSSDLVFSGYNRFFIYRFLNAHIHAKMKNKAFSSLGTRVFRYALATTIYENTKSLELVANTLGHKNVENSKYYILHYKHKKKTFNKDKK